MMFSCSAGDVLCSKRRGMFSCSEPPVMCSCSEPPGD